MDLAGQRKPKERVVKAKPEKIVHCTVQHNAKNVYSIDVQSDIGFLLAMPCHNFTSMVKSCDHLL